MLVVIFLADDAAAVVPLACKRHRRVDPGAGTAFSSLDPGTRRLESANRRPSAYPCARGPLPLHPENRCSSRFSRRRNTRTPRSGPSAFSSSRSLRLTDRSSEHGWPPAAAVSETVSVLRTNLRRDRTRQAQIGLIAAVRFASPRAYVIRGSGSSILHARRLAHLR